MICPYCHYSDTRVVEKRDLYNGSVSRRRRECISCKTRFTTYEKIEKLPVKVIKKDGNLQEFDREKLHKSIFLCGQKRLGDLDVDKMVDEIEAEVLKRNTGQISTSDIGRIVLSKLKQVDKVAYMRFASVFLDFGSLESFKSEIAKIE